MIQSQSVSPLPPLKAATLLLLLAACAAKDHHPHHSSKNSMPDEKNLFDMRLEPCSTDGMAVTGCKMRDGRCAHLELGDERSHPICLSMPSQPTFVDGLLVPGEDKKEHGRRGLSIYSLYKKHFGKDEPEPQPVYEENFFTITGQDNWMEEPLPCMDNGQKTCPVVNWCVNEGAFAQFVDYVGGCHKIGTIQCEATNKKALETYENRLKFGQGDLEQIQAALDCLKDRCWVP